MIKKYLKLNLIVALFLWLGALMILFMSEEYMTDGLFLTALLFVAGGLIIARNGAFKLEDKKSYLLVAVLSVYFLLALSWSRMFENPLWDVYLELGLARKIFVYGLLYVIVPVGIFISMCEILARISSMLHHVRLKSIEGVEESKAYVGPFIALTVISFILILASYPGLSEPDGWGLWNWVQNGVYDEWHTIGYLFFVKLCSMIWNSLFSVELANVLLYLVVNYWALKILSRFFSKRGLWIYVAVTVLLLSPLMYLQGMNKDTVYNISLFGACIGIYMLTRAEKVKLSDMIFMAVFFLGTAIFRHAGLFVCELALVITLVYLIRQKAFDRVKLSAILMATTAIGYFVIVVLIGRWTLHANPNPPYVKYSVPMYIMGAMASDEDVELTSEQVEVYEMFAPVENWRSAHTRYYADPVSREWGPVLSYPTAYPESVYGPAIIRTNFQFLVKYPGKYITNFLDETSILWEITRPQDGMEVALTPTLLGSERYANDTASVKANGFTTFIREYSDFAARLPIYRSLVWRGGFAQFCYIVLICLAGKKKRGQLVLILLPLMLYYLSLYLSIPAQATRYIVGALEILPFFAAECYSRYMHDESN